MDLAETDAHGAEAARIDAPAGPPRAPGADQEAVRSAAARYFDAWERNQSEIARRGPPAG